MSKKCELLIATKASKRVQTVPKFMVATNEGELNDCDT